MDIYDIINNAAFTPRCNSTKENKYIMVLDRMEFWDVYRGVEGRNTFLVIDKEGDINFYIKLNDLLIIKELHENSRISLDVEWNKYGPEIVLAIEGIERIQGFILELGNDADVFILQRFIKNQKIYVQYIVQDEAGIIKLLTQKVQIEDSFVERLKYYVEMDFYSQYPRIDEEETCEEKGFYIKTEMRAEVLEEVLNTAEEFRIPYKNKSITVYITADDFYRVIFSGDMQYVKNIMIEMSKRINVMEEGSTIVRGKPFFRYCNGLLYFFKVPSGKD